jgi:hypothetical protein
LRRSLPTEARSLLRQLGPPCFSLLSNYGNSQEVPVLQEFLELWGLGSLFFVKITLILAK